jgi:hypothetical protein
MTDRSSFFDFGRGGAPDFDSPRAPFARAARDSASTASHERRVIGPDGREWRVREVPMPSYDRRGGSCLIFETNDAARRVRHYPSRWYECDDAELYGLSLHA